MSSPMGTTMLWTWDGEQTRWFNRRFDAIHDLEPLLSDPPAPDLPQLESLAEKGYFLRPVKRG